MAKKFSFSGINGILLSNFLLQFGFSIVGIFIPLYIFKITNSFFWILWFYLLFNLVIIISTLPTAKLIARFGSDKISFAGALVRLVFLIFLILAGKNPFFFILAAIFWGLAVPFCWIPFHLSIVGTDHTLSFGKDATKINFTNKIGVIAGPILGGLIIQSFGFNALYSVSFVFIMLSGIPLFFDKYEFKFPEISFRAIKENLPIRQMPRLFLGFFGAGLFNGLQEVVWPIYVFLLVGSYRFLGDITSIGLFGSFLLLAVVGQLADRFGSKILKISVPLNILNWLSRIFLTAPLSLFLINLAYQLVSIFVWIPLDQLSYQTAVQTKRLEYFLSREIAIHFGSFVAILILIFGLGLFGLNWPMAFVFSALSLLFILQLGFAKEEGVKSVGIALIKKDGSILMQLRDNDEITPGGVKNDIVFPGHWCLPGGKIKIGQTPEKAAFKELRKIIGYEAESFSFLTEESYMLPIGKKVIRHIFWAEYDESQEIKCLEGQRMEFLKPEDLDKKKIFPGHKELYQKALQKFLNNKNAGIARG